MANLVTRTAYFKQTLIDFALQNYGNEIAVGEILRLNPQITSYTHVFNGGEKITIDTSSPLFIQANVNYIASRLGEIGTYGVVRNTGIVI